MRTLTRATLWATFRVLAASTVLYGALAVGAFIWFSTPAYPQGSEHAKAELTPPEAKPCELPLWYLAELSGWRVLEGAQAKAYLGAAFSKHPPADAVAFTVSGSKAAIILAKGGCIVGRRMTTAELHAKVMIKAFGWPA